MQQGSYQLKIIHSETKGEIVFYTIQVLNVNSKLSWQFEERYRNMHQLSAQIKQYESRLPTFPPKKMFGNTDPEFVSQRKAALQNYFKTLLQYVDVEKIPPLKEFLTRGDAKQVRDAKPEQQQTQQLAQRQVPQTNQANQPSQSQFNKAKQIKNEYEKITTDTNAKFIDMGFMVNAPDDNDIEKKRFIYDSVNLKVAEPLRVPLMKNPDAVLLIANPTLEQTQEEFFHLLGRLQKELNQILGVD